MPYLFQNWNILISHISLPCIQVTERNARATEPEMKRVLFRSCNNTKSQLQPHIYCAFDILVVASRQLHFSIVFPHVRITHSVITRIWVLYDLVLRCHFRIVQPGNQELLVSPTSAWVWTWPKYMKSSSFLYATSSSPTWMKKSSLLKLFIALFPVSQ